MKFTWKNAIDMPHAWLLIFLVITWLLHVYLPVFEFEFYLGTLVGWALMALGVALSVWAIFQFGRHKTSVVPRHVPQALIAAGPYRYSRNPIYLADAMILAGFSLVIGSAIGLVSVALFVRLIEIRFIRAEESGLKAEFPEDFAAFCAKTRRWM